MEQHESFTEIHIANVILGASTNIDDEGKLDAVSAGLMAKGIQI